MSPRLFVAVRPPDDVLAAVSEVSERAKRSIVGPRWTTPDQWHVTLRFLGNVEEERVDDVRRALERLSAVPPFPLRLGGGGAFPTVTRARVVWLGVTGGSEALSGLAAGANRALVPLGFLPEERAYHPHLTLARLRQPGDVRPAVDAVGDEAVGRAFTVDEVVLYESRTRRTGAEYEPVGSVALVG